MENSKQKIVAVGDTHGRNLWELIYRVEEDEDLDKFIFIGDFFDSREFITGEDQIKNFEKIIDFKRKNNEMVVLLLGNHDYHYLKGVNEYYSNFQNHFYSDINKLVQKAFDEKLFSICYQYDNFIFSHAGITNSWCERHNIDTLNIVNSINNSFYDNLNILSFNDNYISSNSGDDITQSPIWVRIPSLLQDFIKLPLIQVIGHTTLTNLTSSNNLIAIDCLGTSKEYLVIKNGKPQANKLILNGK